MMQRGLAASRHAAQALILAGQVFSFERRIEKPGQLLAEEADLRVRERLPFVSRGGLKLAHALKEFSVDPAGLVCLDVGASTGGFTDCLLQSGARRVYAVDVGYGQFHAKLRGDPRVVLIEKTNFRYIDPALIPEQMDLAVIDVAFISLSKILPKAREFLKRDGRIVALVKPQFELGPKDVKKGVVRSEALRERAVEKVETEAKALSLKPSGRAWSPVEGPKGNRECLILLKNTATLKAGDSP